MKEYLQFSDGHIVSMRRWKYWGWFKKGRHIQEHGIPVAKFRIKIKKDDGMGGLMNNIFLKS